ncbi:MAG: hypothetical protein KME22_00325 [Hassallia sp. WJT32-NPBG1]|jgi:hypothetical protein|nr:hypothetical protein [Hassallia sp. WJT32-NPBG1]
MLTSSQLDLLIYSQWGCDRSPLYFPQAVIDASKQFNISNLELETLIAWIETLNPEKIRFPAIKPDVAGVIFN